MKDTIIGITGTALLLAAMVGLFTLGESTLGDGDVTTASVPGLDVLADLAPVDLAFSDCATVATFMSAPAADIQALLPPELSATGEVLLGVHTCGSESLSTFAVAVDAPADLAGGKEFVYYSLYDMVRGPQLIDALATFNVSHHELTTASAEVAITGTSGTWGTADFTDRLEVTDLIAPALDEMGTRSMRILRASDLGGLTAFDLDVRGDRSGLANGALTIDAASPAADLLGAGGEAQVFYTTGHNAAITVSALVVDAAAETDAAA